MGTAQGDTLPQNIRRSQNHHGNDSTRISGANWKKEEVFWQTRWIKMISFAFPIFCWCGKSTVHLQWRRAKEHKLPWQQPFKNKWGKLEKRNSSLADEVDSNISLAFPILPFFVASSKTFFGPIDWTHVLPVSCVTNVSRFHASYYASQTPRVFKVSLHFDTALKLSASSSINPSDCL